MQIHYDGLQKTDANFVPLSPVSFLHRAEKLHGDRLAVVYGDVRVNWSDLAVRIRTVANGLIARGLGKGDTVSVLCPNTPQLFELQFAVPMTGAVINTLNTRLETETIAYILDHADTKLVIVDAELSGVLTQAFETLGRRIETIEISDPHSQIEPTLGGDHYEDLVQSAPIQTTGLPSDEWDAIALNYTSGTSGRPKGVVYHHRGAYLMAMGTVAAWQVPHYPVYLSVVPMFHCNGWGHPWVMAMLGATTVFTRTPAPDRLLEAIQTHGVTHMGAAPIVLQMLVDAADQAQIQFDPPVRALTAGAPPPPSVLDKSRAIGLDVMQVYGLTETYGHISKCLWQDSWDAADPAEQSRLRAQQGIAFPMVQEVAVIDRDTGIPVAQDSTQQGEIAIRGNTVMKGYYKDPDGTALAFADGWFWSGDGAVVDTDGYIQIKDRLKDVIISGGENISSVEVEAVIYDHPAVLAAAVIAKPDPKWGEVPCAFVELRADMSADADDIIQFCRSRLAGFKTPKSVVFGDLPKTSTGKIQKFQLRQLALDTRS